MLLPPASHLPSLVPGIALALVLAAAGCDSDSDSGEESAADAAIEQADANLLCPSPTAALPSSYRPINQVAATGLSVDGSSLLVDATAGGYMAFGDNPFIYVSFASGTPEKVEITDTDSYESDVWDLALKRTVIRTNSGDSGPGGVSAAAVSGSFESAGEPPEQNYRIDDFATGECELLAGMIGEPLTAFDGWYEYDTETNQVSPAERVYFVKSDSHRFKLQILDYYRGGDSANYELRWEML